MRIEYTVRIWREGGQYIAHAMPIDVASAGASAEQARQALDEAVGLFLSVARTQGTLPHILEECSYEFRDGDWRSSECVAWSRRDCAGTSHDLP
jgi:predicted RNase H-like HicB family nuclease